MIVLNWHERYLEELILKAEELRQGSTEMAVVTAFLTANFTWEEISFLKQSAKTQSGLFGDVLLIALGQIRAETIDDAAARLLKEVDEGRMVLFDAYSRWMAVVREWGYDGQMKYIDGSPVFGLRYFLTLREDAM